jgi:hypothetical protein
LQGQHVGEWPQQHRRGGDAFEPQRQQPRGEQRTQRDRRGQQKIEVAALQKASRQRRHRARQRPRQYEQRRRSRRDGETVAAFVRADP